MQVLEKKSRQLKLSHGKVFSRVVDNPVHPNNGQVADKGAPKQLGMPSRR